MKLDKNGFRVNYGGHNGVGVGNDLSRLFDSGTRASKKYDSSSSTPTGIFDSSTITDKSTATSDNTYKFHRHHGLHPTNGRHKHHEVDSDGNFRL